MPESEKSSFNFTAARLADLRPPKVGEANYHDTGVDGLCIRMRATGAASYIIRYRLPGDNRSKRITLGTVGMMSIAAARTAAQEAMLSARKGMDPLEGRKAAARSTTEARARIRFAELIDEHECAQQAAGISSAKAAANSMRRELKSLLKMPVTEISRHDLTTILARVRNGIPGHTKPRPGLEPTLRAHIHGLLAYGHNEGRIASNVMFGYREKRKSKAQRVEEENRRAERDVMLTMEEVAALWQACGDKRVRPAFGAYVRLLLLWGTRRGETAVAKLSWISAAKKGRTALLTIPAEHTKAGRAFVVPVVPLAASVINNVPRHVDDSFITPGAVSRATRKTTAISGWSKSWPALLKVAGDHGLRRHVRMHDLRRAFRSHMARLGVNDRLAAALLNHAPADRLIGAYDKYDYVDEKTQALIRWASEIEFALANTPADIVSKERSCALRQDGAR